MVGRDVDVDIDITLRLLPKMYIFDEATDVTPRRGTCFNSAYCMVGWVEASHGFPVIVLQFLKPTCLLGVR